MFQAQLCQTIIYRTSVRCFRCRLICMIGPCAAIRSTLNVSISQNVGMCFNQSKLGQHLHKKDTYLGFISLYINTSIAFIKSIHHDYHYFKYEIIIQYFEQSIIYMNMIDINVEKKIFILDSDLVSIIFYLRQTNCVVLGGVVIEITLLNINLICICI